jgi:hypothetical protein
MDDETYPGQALFIHPLEERPQILYAEWKGFATSAESSAALLPGCARFVTGTL